MKIANVELMPCVIRQEDPEWRYAGGESPQHEGFILKVVADDGLVGLGYFGAGSRFRYSRSETQAVLEAYTESLIGQDSFHIEKILGIFSRVVAGNNRAKAAIEMALYDLQGKALNLPVYALLGGLVREEIPIIRMVALKEPAEMAANALKLVEQDYAYIKVKLGGEPAKDLERIKEIRKAVGDTIHLTVDANTTYSPKVAIDTLKRMQEYGVELCEQPVRADDWLLPGYI